MFTTGASAKRAGTKHCGGTVERHDKRKPYGVVNGATGELRATNVTVAYNSAVGVMNVIPGTVTLVNTLLAFNHPGGDCSGPITSVGHNANVDGTCG